MKYFSQTATLADLPRLLFLGAVILVTHLGFRASAETVIMPGTADIFSAGHPTVPPLAGGGGTLAPSFSLPPGTGRILTFSSVTGLIWFEAIYQNGPDGGPLPEGRTDVDSFGGISGMFHPSKVEFLAGVFTDDSEPTDPAPPRRNGLTDSSQIELTDILLNQSFYIGDGLTGTGSGAVQGFHIPDSATRLHFGVLDAFNLQGTPSGYADNGGQFIAQFSVTAVGVPDPGSMASLLLLGVVGLFVLRRSHKIAMT